MMRKLLLLYYEPIPSGHTTHVLSLVKGLDRSKWALTVVLPDHLPTAVAAFQQAGVKVVTMPLRKVWWGWRSYKTLYRMVRQEGYDIVHIHSQEAGLTGRLLCRLAGARRIVYTPQTIDVRRWYLHWFYRFLEVLLSYITERIISVNEADRRRLIRWGIRAEKVVTIPNGIDVGFFEKSQPLEDASHVLGVPLGSPLVVQVGRLAAQKDPLAFLMGATQVLRSHPRARFVMLGEGPMKADVEAFIVRHGLVEQVRVLGHRSDAARWMASAAMVTLTSRWEGTPYSLMEAMACKKPVVCTDVNGCQELVEDGKAGYVVASGDVSAWADRVSCLLAEPATRQRFGREGSRRVRELYSLEVMIDRLVSVYEVLPETRPREVTESL